MFLQKKKGSLPPVKIYTSRNINSMIIIQFFFTKYKLLQFLLKFVTNEVDIFKVLG